MFDRSIGRDGLGDGRGWSVLRVREARTRTEVVDYGVGGVWVRISLARALISLAATPLGSVSRTVWPVAADSAKAMR